MTIVGFAVQSRGTNAADALRIWQPYQMLFSTRLVAAVLLPTHGPCRFGGSCSWMNTTVPAFVFAGDATGARTDDQACDEHQARQKPK